MATPEILIGCGGWEYFNVDGDRLTRYASFFNIVEVNSTFYQLPLLSRVDGWRHRTPSRFVFTVKCHRSVTHDSHLKVTPKTREVMSQMNRICNHLAAPFLVVQCPKSFQAESSMIDRVDMFLSEMPLGATRVAIEFRDSGWNLPSYQKAMENMLRRHGAVLIQDYSRTRPSGVKEWCYGRIFGEGNFNTWDFTDDELRAIVDTVRRSSRTLGILVYHSIRMHEHALRSRSYLRTGRIPQRSLDSMDHLASFIGAAQFPATRERLIAQLGWRVISLKKNTQQRLGSFLNTLPERVYCNPDEVLVQLRARMGSYDSTHP